MTGDGSLFFAAKDATPVALGALALGAAFVAWSYWRRASPPWLRASCAALKMLGLAALAACLVEPTWTGQRVKPRANIVAVIADNSRSMSLKGRDEPTARGDELRALLTGPRSDWRDRLAKDFDVRNFLADSRLEPTRDFTELNFEGRSSSLGASLRSVAERYRGQPLAGIVLLTDGVAGDLTEATELRGLPPVFPVVLGGANAARDLGVGAVTTTQTAFEDAPVTVQAEIAASGFGGEEIEAKLVAIDSGKAAVSQSVTIPREGERSSARFQFRPEKSGVSFYRVELAPKTKGAAEATTTNNESIVCIDRGAGPHRVLYVSGRPNWEYKFLHRAVEADVETQLVGLIRIARREPKFEFRSRAGESSNPLFRGFGNQSKEEIERYDQPVLVRLNTQDEFELRNGFPKTAEELFKFHALVVDDVEAEFFTPEQMSLVQRFVSERGGGFLMLGGAESFRDGGYQRTAIGEMLPVYLDQPTSGASEELRLDLTREGWLQPWIRLRTNEADEKRRLADSPTLDILNRSGSAKPAAMVVATVSAGGKTMPALATQRFGRGRTAAMLVGDLWHTGLGDEERSKDLGKAWRQIVRWLVADVPEPIEVRVEPRSESQDVKIQVRVRDPKFQPRDNASVAVTVQRVGTKSDPVLLNAEPSANEAGVYETSYVPRESSGYRVDVKVADENGASLGAAQAGWATDLAGAEFRSLVPNRALMENVARQTGGQVLAASDLDSFVKSLPTRSAPAMEPWTQPLWHTPAMFLFALLCLVGEWGLRRWKGLA